MFDASKRTRDWLRVSVEANKPAWTSLPPEQVIALLDALDECDSTASVIPAVAAMGEGEP